MGPRAPEHRTPARGGAPTATEPLSGRRSTAREIGTPTRPLGPGPGRSIGLVTHPRIADEPPAAEGAPAPRPSSPRLGVPWERIILALTLAGLAAGGGAWLAGAATLAAAAWAAAIVAALVPLTVTIARALARGETGVDIIALLALAGALALGEYLAGAVIAVMFASGTALEHYASTRARRELSALLERAPRVVHRYEGTGLTSPPLADVRPRDRLLVKAGEVVPVDGVLSDENAVLDESVLTGETRLAERTSGERVRSGAVNAGGPFTMFATTTAAGSTYAGIIRLVREAQTSKAPFVRLADRYALIFLPLTLAIAGAAWLASGDPVRALAVLVVATPCPLILAAPIAIIAGISRAAQRGIVMKGGAVLEALSRSRVLLFDKTGTLTMGRPVVTEVLAPGGRDPDEIVRLAASLDQVSTHVLAAAIVQAARERGRPLVMPTDVTEESGRGVRGRVDGHTVAVGRADWAAGDGELPEWARKLRRRTAFEGAINVFVAVDGTLAGALILEDPVRPDTARTIRALRAAGIGRVVMVTGDHVDVAETVGAAVGVDAVLAERSPADKVEAVRGERAWGSTIMVGDGVNDAPALAAADVGVAMGARGATASSEAADVVLVVDRLDRLAEALRLARRARGIALQSVVAGIGMSLAVMALAAFGWVPPAAGALVQEAIDVAVILNALRALGGYGAAAPPRGPEAALSQRFRSEHAELLPVVNRVRAVADRLDPAAPRAALADVRDIYRFLIEDLLPHEAEEERSFYPLIAKTLGGDDPTGTMVRGHVEIAHLVRVLGRLLEDLPAEGPGADDLPELRRVLYGLYAILRLHFAQEEEAYLSLFDVPPASAA
ncbi:MAG: heavy metal translocating P-type ATPase [Chloroflexota bacterium]|nr:heavy metal translocating P-type ATPase [Chloroflexota bacterium]